MRGAGTSGAARRDDDRRVVWRVRTSRVFERVAWNTKRLAAAVVAIGHTRCRGDVDVAPTIRSDTMTISGWAIGRDLRSVLVVVGGETRLARLGIERPDVARARPRDASARCSGWEIAVDLGGREGESLSIEAFALTGDGLVGRVAARRVDVVAGPVFRFDDPLDGWPVAPAFVSVWGTALGSEAVSRVDLFADGAAIGPARLHAGPTPHLSSLPLPGSPLASFSSMLDLRGRVAGDLVEISAIATLASGATAVIAPVTATVRSPDWPPAPEPPSPRLTPAPGVLASAPSAPHDTPVLLVVTHDLAIGGGQLYLLGLLGQLQERTDWR
ncbi:MAG TPA: hypothetical protein VHS03_09995, partial [Gaiellaceae bacterium]|nr:hypothetical protein [Gaiellaceae bacterium]